MVTVERTVAYSPSIIERGFLDDGKTVTDRRDALHLLDLLRHNRFPTIWVLDPATRDLRALLTHRMRLAHLSGCLTMLSPTPPALCPA